MKVIFRKIIILGMLLGCVWAFGLSGNTVQQVAGAGCIQDCEASEAMCWDSCSTACSTSDIDCNACFSSCASEFRRCMRTAEWCEGGGGYYTASCSWSYGFHCPLDSNGLPDCDDPSTHENWYQVCNRTGGTQCHACPINEYCGPTNPGPTPSPSPLPPSC